MNDTVSQFRDAMCAVGLEPPSDIKPGKYHRFPGVGKPKGNTAGWCKLYSDSLGGCFGDWSTDLKKPWRAKLNRQFSQSEQEAYSRNAEEVKTRLQEEQRQRHARAAKKANLIWESAGGAPDDHPYLVRKGVHAHGICLCKNSLVIPVWSNRKIQSLQFIGPDGSKRFLKGGKVSGGYCRIGSIENADIVCITEGFATGATIHEATDHPAIVAFNSGNLELVANIMQQKFPEMPIVICADDDISTKGNPGVTEANKAAQAIGAKVAIPRFKAPRSEDVTDFNDMALQIGLKEVARVINAATQPDLESDAENKDWPDPLPLMAKIELEPYPLDALPDTLRAAVEEVQAFVKAPIPLVTFSALSTVSLAVQAHVDVKRDETLIGPVSLFMLTIADSGERKSTCDRYFMKAIREYDLNQEELAEPEKKIHKAAVKAWNAKCRGIEDKIRQLSKEGKPTQERELALSQLESNEPEPPQVPRILFTDVTPQDLRKNLAKQWPSVGVISSEAGLVFGSHGMGKDSIMCNLTTYNQLWDGLEFAVDRLTSESFKVRGARLTIGLQVQEATLRNFLRQNGELARGTGFLARILIARPESTQGTRFFTAAPNSWPALDKFNNRITEILEQDVPFNKNGILTPSALSLSAQAKAAWVKFYDTIERELRRSGKFYEVRDVASKIADNAARLAALFHYFEFGNCEQIGLEAFEKASRTANWYLNEALRLYGELSISEEQTNVEYLDTWLLDNCQKKNTNIISRREVQQKITPTRLRKKGMLNAPLKELIDRGRVRQSKKGKRIMIYINPALLDSRPCDAANLDKKGELDKDATATPATVATLEATDSVTVAPVATVAVAQRLEPVVKLSSDE